MSDTSNEEEKKIRAEYERCCKKLCVIAVGGGGGKIVYHELLSAIWKDKSGLNYLLDLAIGERFIFINSGPELNLYREKFSDKHLVDIGEGMGAGNPAMGQELYFKARKKVESAIEAIVMQDGKLNADFFVVVNTCGGGTGSGVTPHLLRDLVEKYPSAMILNFIIFPEEERAIGTYSVPYTISQYSKMTTECPEEMRTRMTMIVPFVLSNRHCFNALMKDKTSKYKSPEDINPIIIRCITLLLGIILKTSLGLLPPGSRVGSMILEKIGEPKDRPLDKQFDHPVDPRAIINIGGSFVVPIMVEGAPRNIADGYELSKRVFSRVKSEGFWVSEREGKQRFGGSLANLTKIWTGKRILAMACGPKEFATYEMMSHLSKAIGEIEFPNAVNKDCVWVMLGNERTILILVSGTYFEELTYWCNRLKSMLNRKKDYRDIQQVSGFKIEDLQKIYQEASEYASSMKKERDDIERKLKAAKLKKKETESHVLPSMQAPHEEKE